MKKRKYTIWFIIAGAVLIAALLFMLPASLDKAGRDNGQGAVTEENTAENEQPEADAGPDAVIFCASDYQEEPGWDAPSANLAAILDSAVSGIEAKDTEAAASDSSTEGDTEAIRINGFIMCGDYTNDANLYDYQLSPDESISEIRGIVSEKAPDVSDDDMIFIQGNHDALTDEISESGLHEFDDYLVYVLNTQNDFPWKQGRTSGTLNKVRDSSEALRACLTELADRGETRPVIIAGHVPLHFTARTSSRHGNGDNMYSSLIFNAVNEAGRDLDIIYLFGHNHSKGWDCYMGGSSVMRKAGDTVLIPELDETSVTTDKYTEETLTFTYMNAGYTGYYMNCGPKELNNGTWREYEAADMTLTGTVIEIYGDRIEISRWDSEGMHQLSSQGEADPYRGGIDSGLIDESSYGTEVKSPQVIVRHAVGN